MDIGPLTTALSQPRASRPGRRRRLRAAAVCAVLTVLPACAQKPTEYDVKAAYLFNFGKFLRQPDTAEKPRAATFDICVMGRDDFSGVLERLTANENVNGIPERTLKVATVAAARKCAILFVSASESASVDQLLKDLSGYPVLTVSDMPHFLHRGGMIEFKMQASHVRFSVDLDAVSKAGLGLSSELLKVALQVTGAPRRGA
jgi:hypothetical protein